MSDFNCTCKTHLKYIQYYCINCNINICEICAKEHSDEIYQMIILSQIGLTNEEDNQIRILLDEINNNIEHIQKIKENILSFYNNLKEIKENSFIYKSNGNNNFKFVFINY